MVGLPTFQRMVANYLSMYAAPKNFLNETSLVDGNIKEGIAGILPLKGSERFYVAKEKQVTMEYLLLCGKEVIISVEAKFPGGT